MKVNLLHITEDAEKIIEYAARTCCNSIKNMGKDDTFLEKIIDRGHHSVLEHASATFDISDISIACARQLQRHRLASFSEKSLRYTEVEESNVLEDMFVFPEDTADEKANYGIIYDDCYDMYKYFIENLNIKKEDARFVLPLATKTKMVMTANFREWLHIIDMRVSKYSQWEIKELIRMVWKVLYEECKNVFGLTYFKYSRDYLDKKIFFNGFTKDIKYHND